VKQIKKLNTALLTVLSLIIISGVMFSTTSFASSLNSISTTNNKTTASEIPKSVLRHARVTAEESILGLNTEAQIKQLVHSHDLETTLKSKNLSLKDFREEVRTEMTAYLTSKGYSQTQITAALNSRYVRRHKHNI